MEGTCFRKTIDESFLERKKKWIKTYQTDDTSRYWRNGLYWLTGSIIKEIVKRRQSNDSLKTEGKLLSHRNEFSIPCKNLGWGKRGSFFFCDGFEHVVNCEKILLARCKGHHFTTRVCNMCHFQHGSSNVYLCLSRLLGCKT